MTWHLLIFKTGFGRIKLKFLLNSSQFTVYSTIHKKTKKKPNQKPTKQTKILQNRYIVTGLNLLRRWMKHLTCHWVTYVYSATMPTIRNAFPDPWRIMSQKRKLLSYPRRKWFTFMVLYRLTSHGILSYYILAIWDEPMWGNLVVGPHACQSSVRNCLPFFLKTST